MARQSSGLKLTFPGGTQTNTVHKALSLPYEWQACALDLPNAKSFQSHLERETVTARPSVNP